MKKKKLIYGIPAQMFTLAPYATLRSPGPARHYAVTAATFGFTPHAWILTLLNTRFLERAQFPGSARDATP